MGLPFRKIKKLWLLYLFLLFFSFFMFTISINVYLQSMNESNSRNLEIRKKLKHKLHKNVVAHYIGTGNIFGNISKDDYNQNNFNPNPLDGAMGNPVVIPAKDELQKQKMFHINKFNLLASDRMPLNRTLKDYRIQQCIDKKYENLPTTSVIISFHNEAWSVLLRTVWSVINRSPKDLLKEIILVDDASERKFLKTDLENYVKTLPIDTKIFRMQTRQGLVAARLLGAKNAKGDVLTFLDAHCECSPGWLEPLLSRIKENRQSVVCPVIDIISDENFGYVRTFENHSGAFNWQLHFRWFVLGKEQIDKRLNDVTKPIPTPGMAGGLFSIDKNYFFEMGSYDENMKIWGGENVEMSFRIWQCGGKIEINPCSHVGHLFRKKSPYSFPGGVNEVLSTNLARVALVWMDEWSDFFFLYNPIDAKIRNSVDVSDRLKLRQNLKCKPFSWYLKNVWPDNFFPAEDRFFGKIVLLKGNTKLITNYNKYMYTIPQKFNDQSWETVFKQIQFNSDKLINDLNVDEDLCLRSPINEFSYGNSIVSPIVIDKCNLDHKLQDIFVITPNGQIMTNENICIDLYQKESTKTNDNTNSTVIRLFQCHNDVRQHWTYDLTTQEIRHKKSNLCLTADEKPNNKNVLVKADNCQEMANQKWGLIPLPWKY